jgi:O-antigen/teichoic acid export membrane protein
VSIPQAEQESVSELAAAQASLEEAAEVGTEGPGLMSALLARVAQLRRPGLGQATLRASAWSATGYGVQTALRFISRLVLAKLVLDASPMGDVAIVVVVIAGLEMISDLGISFGIIQHQKAGEDRYIGTAFSVQAIRGVIIWVVASALSPVIAAIYHEPRLTGLLLLASLSSLVKAFANPGIWLFTRQMQLRIPTLLTCLTEIAGFAVTIVWAILSPTAWAIVAGTVASSAAFALGSHLFVRRTRFRWDREMARDIIHFGGWMVLSSATYFMSSRGESLMLRGAVDPVEFGCFAFASMLVTTPVIAITQLASQVFFPMLATEMRRDRGAAQRHFERGKWVFTGLAVCFVWGAFFVAPPLIRLMHLSKSFAALAWMVPLLGVRAALDIYVSPTGSVLFAAGASRYSAFANVIRLIVLVSGLYFTVGRWGLSGAIWVLVGAPAISYSALLPGLVRHLPTALRTELLNLIVFWVGVALAFALRFIIFQR